MGSPWVVPSPGAKYGGALANGAAATSDDTALSGVAGPSAVAEAAESILSPQSPLFWAGGLIAISLGLMAFSTTVRVGKASTSLSVGKS